MERMKMMFTIVGRGDGYALSKLYEQNGVGLHLQVIAEGTATSEILNILGMTHREKEILISFAPELAVEKLLAKLDDDFRGILSVRGLAFSMRLSAISGAAAKAMENRNAVKGELPVHGEREHCLILAAVNQGYTDEVMQTACKAGATGGTVVRGRWVGAQMLEHFHSIQLQDEKELLIIACTKEARNGIMDAINAHHGLKSDQQTFLCSLPIDRMVKLS